VHVVPALKMAFRRLMTAEQSKVITIRTLGIIISIRSIAILLLSASCFPYLSVWHFVDL